MKYLIDKNPKNVDGITPLHWAAFKGHLEICRFLMVEASEKIPNMSLKLHLLASQTRWKTIKESK